MEGEADHSTLKLTMQNWIESDIERLEGEQAATFRSALGLILYISQDRPDIQFSTKTLATYMSQPCVKAMAAVKHLALYLASNEEGGFLLRRCEPYASVFDRNQTTDRIVPQSPWISFQIQVRVMRSQQESQQPQE